MATYQLNKSQQAAGEWGRDLGRHARRTAPGDSVVRVSLLTTPEAFTGL